MQVLSVNGFSIAQYMKVHLEHWIATNSACQFLWGPYILYANDNIQSAPTNSTQKRRWIFTMNSDGDWDWGDWGEAFNIGCQWEVFMG